MSDYLDAKRIFCKMLGIKDLDGIDEESDIIIPTHSYGSKETETSQILVRNDIIKTAFDSMKEQKVDDMQLYSDHRYEVAVATRWMRMEGSDAIEDPVNGIKYSMGDASLEYIMMICDQMCETSGLEIDGSRMMRFAGRIPFREGVSLDEYIAKRFRVRTITIESIEPKKIAQLSLYCSSFEYLYMYQRRFSIVRIHSFANLYERSGGGRARVNELEEPPRRAINKELLEYYAMAVDSEDPFTAYISFYHVLEYYFDEVYKKRLVKEMKDRITNPGFSYKNDSNLYDLARWIGNKMKNDEASGRGNEFDSLKYVMEEYVSINDLIASLEDWNPDLRDYYGSKNVVFSGNKKDRIAWDDSEGVYTNLAKRIYGTRNALVHSKSNQSEKHYKPQKHKADLEKELPLIQIIAERILFEDGEVL